MRIDKIPYRLPKSTWLRNSPFLPIVFMYRFAGHRLPVVFVCLLMFIGAMVFTLLNPYVVGEFIQAVVSNDNVDYHIKKFFLCYVGLEVGFWLLHGPARAMERYTSFIIEANYRTHLFKTLSTLPLEWHREHHTGESITKLNKAAAALRNFAAGSFELIYMCARIFGAAGALWFLDRRISIAAFVMLALCTVIIIACDKYLIRWLQKLNDLAEHISSAVHDYINNVATVLTLRLQPRAGKALRERLVKPEKIFKLHAACEEAKWAVISFVMSIIIASSVIFWLYQHEGATSTISVAAFYMIFDYLRRISDSIYTFAWRYTDMVYQAVDIRAAIPIEEAHLHYFTAAEDEVQSISNWKKVEIRNLSYTYAGGVRKALDNVSITFEKGKRIALVGESGSGKSTFMSVIRGMHRTKQLEVVVDSVLQPQGLLALEDSIELLPQMPEVFNESIRFNITIGLDTSEEALLKAIAIARFSSVVARLPHGLDSNVNEKGVNLSGGERQRLALARGIFFSSDKELILFDEATSSVDPVNERHIYENIFREAKEKCIVCSIHRLNLLDLFDYVYVFAHGKLVEEGRPQQLLKNSQSMLSSMYMSLHQDEAQEVVPV